jgi:small conductance mechanosensitive channel
MLLVALVGMFLADKLVRRAIGRYAKKIHLDPHAENILKLVSRIFIFAVGAIVLLSVLGIPTEWFVGVSALTGAAIGFASTQTVGNFLAGFYLMISRPFMVSDYVQIGDAEGEVQEITINYTKIYTPTYTLTEIPNRKVLDSTIINHSCKQNLIDYSFPVGFPHSDSITTQMLVEECLHPTLKRFYKKHRTILPKKPILSIFKMNRLEKSFLIRLFFPEGLIDKFYDIQPELLQDIASNWDSYKIKKKKDNSH